jgi:NADH dehydrogenase [ubiquinone] 1 alpha subcomplex assembly factor 7
MRLSDFCALALASYYGDRDPLGVQGDFITAPEISQIFGELIGLFMGAVWQDLGSPDPVNVIELGPGRGTLMIDAMRAAKRVPGFTHAARIHLVETSQNLQAIQAAKLPNARHHSRVQSVPDGPALILANEFFDCLIPRQLERTAQGWFERYVHLDPHQQFALTLGSQPLDYLVPEDLRRAEAGAVYETAPQASALAQELALMVAANGCALIIDYGHKAKRLGATIQALKAHQFHRVLEIPGLADITAHVDFSALVESASRHAQVFGPIDQGLFLDRLGLWPRSEQLAAARPDLADELQAASWRLSDADAMGQLFQVMCLMPQGTINPPPGFLASERFV